jgi:hypothetical protein
VFSLFLPAASFQKCGDSGDKLEEVRIDAGFKRFKVRGQSGDKTGTKRGQYQYVKKIYSFTYIRPLFRLPSPLPSLVLPCPPESLALVPGFGVLFQ